MLKMNGLGCQVQLCPHKLTWEAPLIVSKSYTELFPSFDDVIKEHTAEFGYVQASSTFNS